MEILNKIIIVIAFFPILALMMAILINECRSFFQNIILIFLVILILFLIFFDKSDWGVEYLSLFRAMSVVVFGFSGLLLAVIKIDEALKTRRADLLLRIEEMYMNEKFQKVDGEIYEIYKKECKKNKSKALEKTQDEIELKKENYIKILGFLEFVSYYEKSGYVSFENIEEMFGKHMVVMFVFLKKIIDDKKKYQNTG